MWIRRIRWNRWPTSGESGTSESGASVETGKPGHSGQRNENVTVCSPQQWCRPALILWSPRPPPARSHGTSTPEWTPLLHSQRSWKINFMPFLGGSLSITWRPVSVHHMWGLGACPLQEGTSASSPLWHLLLPSLPLGPYKVPYLAPQWGTPLSFLAKAPCKHLLYAKEFIFCSKAVLTQHSNIEVCMLVLLLDSLGLTRVKQPAILVL